MTLRSRKVALFLVRRNSYAYTSCYAATVLFLAVVLSHPHLIGYL